MTDPFVMILSLPFLLELREEDTRQAVARIERLASDRSYAVANLHARQTIAILERSLTDCSYAVANLHTRQTVTISERRPTNRSYAVANFHACQTITTNEGICFDFRNLVRNNKIGHKFFVYI